MATETPIPIKETPAYTGRLGFLEGAYGRLEQFGLTPQRVQVGNYRSYELTGLHDLGFLEGEVQEKEQRPRWIIFCTSRDGKKKVVKALVDPHKYSTVESRRESLFYQEARVPLLASLPTNLQGRIGIPDIGRVIEHDGGVSFEMDFIDGRAIGSYHYEAADDITRGDIDTMFEYISAFHNRPLSWWQENAPRYYQTVERHYESAEQLQRPMMAQLTDHRNRFKSRQQAIADLVGNDYAQKMAELINDPNNETLYSLPTEQLTVVIPDFNVGNFMKGSDGKIYHIDPEVARISHPAISCAFLIESLWHKPELYNYALGKALENITDIKMRELLRHELIYLRLSGVAVRFYGDRVKTAMGDQESPEFKHATIARQVLAERIKEAIDKRGVWTENLSTTN